MKITKEVLHIVGTVETFEPYTYECGNYMRGDSTRSSERMMPEPTIPSLGAWINARKAAGLPGGVRMKSVRTGRKGLHTITKIEVH